MTVASTTQKKPAAPRKKSGGSSASRGKNQKRPVRREIGGGVCLALALCVFIGYFGVKAIFLDWFAILLKGLFGYGYWLCAPALLLAGIILLSHHGRPVQLRVSCALLLPLLLGSLIHMVLC